VLLNIGTSMGLHCQVGQRIHVVCILTNILIVPSFVLGPHFHDVAPKTNKTEDFEKLHTEIGPILASLRRSFHLYSSWWWFTWQFV